MINFYFLLILFINLYTFDSFYVKITNYINNNFFKLRMNNNNNNININNNNKEFKNFKKIYQASFDNPPFFPKSIEELAQDASFSVKIGLISDVKRLLLMLLLFLFILLLLLFLLLLYCCYDFYNVY